KGSVTLTLPQRGEVQIQVGAPMMAGVDTFEMTPPGGANGTVMLQLNGNETAAEKAEKLAEALQAKNLAFARNGTTFTFTVDRIRVVDQTQERIGFTFQGDNMQRPGAQDGGSGRADPALGPIPSSLAFSPAIFTDPTHPFTFFK